MLVLKGKRMREISVKILLWYNVLSLGIWCGGTVYQMLVVVPLWSQSPPESLRAFFRGTQYMLTIRHFFGPVTQILRALPLFLLAVVSWHYLELRPWLVSAALSMLIGLLLTRAYVYRLNDVLFARAGADLSPQALRVLVAHWILADRVRFAIMGAGYLCLLSAFQLPLKG